MFQSDVDITEGHAKKTEVEILKEERWRGQDWQARGGYARRLPHYTTESVPLWYYHSAARQAINQDHSATTDSLLT